MPHSGSLGGPIAVEERMMKTLIDLVARLPRRFFALASVTCWVLLGVGIYLQESLGLEPCPMCIVQRDAFILLGITAAIGAIFPRRGAVIGFSLLGMVLSGFGAFVAAKQSWMQWYPPEVATCGRDFYGIIESFPLRDAIPMLFRGTGDCAVVDWTFLGGSIANWSFVTFACMFIGMLVLLVKGGTAR